ncbi:MAG: hypothetical protein AAFX08_05010 [Pseudomonadota bacterium]
MCRGQQPRRRRWGGHAGWRRRSGYAPWRRRRGRDLHWRRRRYRRRRRWVGHGASRCGRWRGRQYCHGYRAHGN